VSRFLTNIEIHPGAVIGKGLFIDHGAGVVIGETAIIGDDVHILSGVVLGGNGKDTGKRHPTIGNRVFIGAGACILGPFRVGDGAKIAAGAVVLAEVPSDATAVGVPARIVRIAGRKIDPMDQLHTPDPMAQELCILRGRLDKLEKLITVGGAVLSAPSDTEEQP
jgi:serine O-acetyltransferase